MQAPTFIHPSAIIDPGAQVGEGTRIWHFSHVMPSARIGQNCNIGQNVFIDNDVSIGDGVKIQNNVSVYKGVIIEKNAFIGPSVVFTNVINPRSFISRKTEFKPTLVREGASIGANATIICGIEIGKYALVGAGAVVTKNIPAFSTWFGNPAKQKGWVSKDGFKLIFNEKSRATCPSSGEKYVLREGEVIILNN